MANTSTEQADFEAFVQSKWPVIDLRRRDDGDYMDFDTRTKWMTWQAARRAPAEPTRKQIEQYLFTQNVVIVGRDVAAAAGLARKEPAQTPTQYFNDASATASDEFVDWVLSLKPRIHSRYEAQYQWDSGSLAAQAWQEQDRRTKAKQSCMNKSPYQHDCWTKQQDHHNNQPR